MGQSIVLENIPAPVKASTTSATWAATNLGRPTRIQVGGQMYVPTSTLTLSVSSTGAGGLDTGTFTYQNLYYLYVIVNQTTLTPALIASTTAPASGPSMPSGYGTAYRAIGVLTGDSNGNVVSNVTGYSPHIAALSGPAGGYDPALGAWVFGVGGSVGSQTSLAIQATQMTGGQNVLLGIGAYSPTIIGQFSSGHTLITNNVYSGSLAADNFVKKSTSFGSALLELGLGDADAPFTFRYAPQAVTSPQSSKTGMWTNFLGSCDISGNWTFGGSVSAGTVRGATVGGSGTGAISLGISVYQSNSGGTALVMCSTNQGTGSAVLSAVYLIRFYFDNSVTWAGTAGTNVFFIAGNNNYTFSLDGSNNLTVSGPAGNHNFKVILNK